ncbi:MAG: hypothetical protein PWP60_1393 [Candidatus Atribacteria bacterium]|nr:hypothetical protein [Candidatus Atribacteria bacterium]MDI3531543.1 hypothetical protein [Candidatus Atribacteria bacterium]
MLFLTLPEVQVSAYQQSAFKRDFLPVVFIQDKMGKVVAASRSFAEIFMGNKEKRFNPDITFYLSPIEVRRARRELFRLLQGEAICGDYYVCRTQDGTPLVVNFTGIPLYDPEGQLAGVVGLVFPCERTYHKWQEDAPIGNWNWMLNGNLTSVPFLSKGQVRFLLSKLSEREIEVLRCIGEGLSLSQISKLLSLSPNTVATYRRSILRKLGLENSAQLVKAAVYFGLASLNPWE